MASEIRVNQIQNRSGLSTVTFSDTGVVISGITTITDLRTTGGALIVGTGASIFSPATNQLALGTNNTEDLRIDASGNVGIGTTNPLNKVSVLVNNPTSLSSGAEGLRITDGTRNVQLTRTGSSYSYGGITGTGSLIYSYDTLSLQADTSNPIIFSTGSSEKVRIDSSGNLGIGTAVPSQKLEVVGGEIKAGRVDSTNEGGQVSFGRATDNATGWYIDVYGNTSTPSLRFVDVSNSAVRATIDGSGRLTLPYQPAFNSSGSGGNQNVSAGSIFPFDIADLNVGSHFNASTYRFTAPVAGVYLFGASFYVNGNITAAFCVNGTQTYGGGDAQPLIFTNTTSTSTSAQLLVSLSANDIVDIRSRSSTSGSTQIYMGHSNFWGYLMG